MNDTNEFINIIEKFVSHNRGKGKQVGEKFRLNHRTHQQSLICFVFGILTSFKDDYDNNNYDLRNEQAMKAAKVMVEAAEQNGSDVFPYI